METSSGCAIVYENYLILRRDKDICGYRLTDGHIDNTVHTEEEPGIVFDSDLELLENEYNLPSVVVEGFRNFIGTNLSLISNAS